MQTNFKHQTKTRAQQKAARARLQAAIERRENKKVRERSGGRCEVVLERMWKGKVAHWRCLMDATEIHHLIGKWRLRGRGRSALSEAKLHCCRHCHRAITGDVNNKLVRVGGPVPHWTDFYRRAV